LSDLLPASEEKEIRSFSHDELKSLLQSEKFLKEKRKKNAGYGYGTGYSMPSLKDLVDQIEFPVTLSGESRQRSGSIARFPEEIGHFHI